LKKKALMTPNMVFKPYLVLKERSLVRFKHHTRQLEGNMRKVCCLDRQRRENCGINNNKKRNTKMTEWFYGIILVALLEIF
jgi:hypothetical protein